jgi:diguanylate cyclase (GGDEF)-like protein
MSFIQYIDDQSLSILQKFFSGITGLSFAIYDSQGALLIPPKGEDQLTVGIRSDNTGRQKFTEFIRTGIGKAGIRKDPSLLKNPAGEYHLFIPVEVYDGKLVFVSGPFCLEKSEFEDTLAARARKPGLSVLNPASWLKKPESIDHSTVPAIAIHIKCLLETFLRSNQERNSYCKSYKKNKTLTDILLNIRLPASSEQVHFSVLDTILLLFDVDTASIMVQEKGIFKTFVGSGRLRDAVISLCLGENNPWIVRSIRDLTPVFSDNSKDLSKLGLPGSITSIYFFPLFHRGIGSRLLLLYNVNLSSEESQHILEFCKLMALVFENLDLQNAHDQVIADMELVNAADSKLIPYLHDADVLCETILGNAMEIVKAEKGSLMMSKEDSLTIKSVEGVNKWLVQDVEMVKGEGIAGKVFRDGKSFFVKNMEEITLPDFKPRGRYRTGSFMSVPLASGSETMGVLNITDKRTGEEFTERDFHLISEFASSSSIALKICNDNALAGRIKEHSVMDALTGLSNRQHFLKRFKEEIRRSERYGNIFSFAIVDIDDFRLFNEKEGRIAGDSVLTEIAGIARGSIRGYDILSRFGGEEFGILMPHTDKGDAFGVVERMREKIKNSLMFRWKKNPVITASIGIASFPQGGKDIEELTESVETALYKAKSTGKNKTVVYDLPNNEDENAYAS